MGLDPDHATTAQRRDATPEPPPLPQHEAPPRRPLSLVASIAPNPPSEPKQARVRRRARKRNGPPQLQFVTATDPSQFKDETAKRSVRSQAMIQYRYRADREKKHPQPQAQGPSPASLGRSPSEPPAVPASSNSSSTTSTSNSNSSSSSSTHVEDVGIGAYDGCPNPQQLLPYTSHVLGGSPWSASPAAYAPVSRYQRALASSSSNRTRQSVIEYENSEEYFSNTMAFILRAFALRAPVGSSGDPFSVLPQFPNPQLDSHFYIDLTHRVCVTQEILVHYFPWLQQSQKSLLSGTIISATWADMKAGLEGDSSATALLKSEVIGWVNARFRDPSLSKDDFTITIVCHLLAGEMGSGNEHAIQMHKKGLTSLIVQRGGPEALCAPLRSPVVIDIAHCDIVCETPEHSLAQGWEYPPGDPPERQAAVAESPLYCPRDEFYTLLKDPRCSAYTYELLCDMRDLTDLFLASNSTGHVLGEELQNQPGMANAPTVVEYDSRVVAIRSRLASLPSAHTPGLPTTGDWIFETCRIAAIIYTSAIIMRTPLSTAAEPSSNIILADIASASPAGAYIHTTCLAEPLYAAFERSNGTDTLWGDMLAVLYWAISVGAAAARRRPASTDPAPIVHPRTEMSSLLQRRLISHSSRLMVMIQFAHPAAMMTAQKRLLMVQDLIGRRVSRKPAP